MQIFHAEFAIETHFVTLRMFPFKRTSHMSVTMTEKAEDELRYVTRINCCLPVDCYAKKQYTTLHTSKATLMKDS